jgi:hypothetical protein
MNGPDLDGSVRSSQLSLSVANQLQLELEDVVTIFFLEHQGIALKEIGSPDLTVIVQITWSLNFASHVPANFSCAARVDRPTRAAE